nr:pathogenesis-related protein 2b [Allium sativum]QYF06700.1 pathogenesis-related protein 2b [Allium sativum]
MKMVAFLLGMLLAILTKNAESIGVCYGTNGNNLPSAGDAVNLIKSNSKFNGVRIYSPDPNILNALSGSNLQVILDVPNPDLQNLAQNQPAAYQWVQNNILKYPSVSFKYIAVGNEVIPGAQAQYVLGAMSNIINALGGAGLTDKIKVSTAVSLGVLGPAYPPSKTAFTADASQYLQGIVKFLVNTGSPLLANVYPYFSYKDNPTQISLQYALFTASGTVAQDGQYAYQNLFDALTDAVYASLEKIGGGSVRIVVSESGWPSAGGFAATVGNAQTYNTNLVNHVGKGTPRRSGQAIETFIFALFNENLKEAGTESNFGLYYPNKQPVYSI